MSGEFKIREQRPGVGVVMVRSAADPSEYLDTSITISAGSCRSGMVRVGRAGAGPFLPPTIDSAPYTVAGGVVRGPGIGDTK